MNIDKCNFKHYLVEIECETSEMIVNFNSFMYLLHKIGFV